jgi:hypothetical protein
MAIQIYRRSPNLSRTFSFLIFGADTLFFLDRVLIEGVATVNKARRIFFQADVLKFS